MVSQTKFNAYKTSNTNLCISTKKAATESDLVSQGQVQSRGKCISATGA